MAKLKSLYECEFCGKTYKTKGGATKHELLCKENANNTESLKNRKDGIKKEIENIRLSATSPEHLIQLIEEFLLTKGLKLTLSEYPSDFRISISNSHNSPMGYPQNWGSKNDDIPKGYPGWRGNWSGIIEVVDHSILNIPKDTTHISLSDIIDTWSSSLMNIWFINTGSGSDGRSRGGFRYDGMLWVYDFPKMKDEFDTSHDSYKLLNKDYMDALKAYHRNFCKERSEFVNSDINMKQLKVLKSQISDLVTELSNASLKLEDDIKNKFNKERGFNLPLPPEAFQNDSRDIMKIHTDVSHNAKCQIENNDKLIQYIEKLSDEIIHFKNDHPEIFI